MVKLLVISCNYHKLPSSHRLALNVCIRDGQDIQTTFPSIFNV